jgi:hypothetical protein
MGIVSTFENDVFVSYAHIDNKPYGVRQSAWVSDFAQDLQHRLSMLAGGATSLWRDPRLRGNQLLWPTIQTSLANSAVLVSVITPRYVESDSCKQEYSSFEAVSKLPIGVSCPNATRLLHIIKLPVAAEKLPQPFRDQIGYQFFEYHPNTGDPIELDRTNPLYFERLNALAHDVANLLACIKKAMSVGSVS